MSSSIWLGPRDKPDSDIYPKVKTNSTNSKEAKPIVALLKLLQEFYNFYNRQVEIYLLKNKKKVGEIKMVELKLKTSLLKSVGADWEVAQIEIIAYHIIDLFPFPSVHHKQRL